MLKKISIPIPYYGRILAILSLRASSLSNDTKMVPLYLNQIHSIFDMDDLSETVQNKIRVYASTLIREYFEHKHYCINQINQRSFNKKYSEFTKTDQILLSIGLIEINKKNKSHTIIKDILHISDLLNNTHAVPYISGILKNRIFGIEPIKKHRKNTKCVIKSS